MVADMISEGWQINVATEIQKGSQADFAVRGTLSSSNIMRRQFKAGNDYSEAPDTIGVFILGFNLPDLRHKKEFVSRIIRADYDDGTHFLADKFSDYYIELHKLSNWKKSDLPEQYHELWDLCVILKTKIKDQAEVIKMQAVQSPLALEFASEVKRAVAPNDFVNETLRRERGLIEIQAYMNRREQSVAEKMIITAFQNSAAFDVIEAMKNIAGITEARLVELKNQAQST